MAKVINFQTNSLLIPFFFEEEYRKSFNNSELGKIYKHIPWDKIVREIDKKLKQNKKIAGRNKIFSTRSELALLILKSYLKWSDRELFEHLESNWKLQMFCNIQIQPGSNLNYKIMTDIRKRISQVFDLQELQKIIIEDWKHETDANSILMDATVFESNVKYPKDMDLLQDSIYWLYYKIRKYRKKTNIPMQKSTYYEVRKAFTILSKQRRKNQKKLMSLLKRQVRLLGKLLEFFSLIINKLEENDKSINNTEKETLSVIKAVYEQRKISICQGKTLNKPILSLYKPFVSKIYRGKAGKQYEIGGKWHLINVDGIVIVQHVSYSPYNEVKMLVPSVELIKDLFGHYPLMLGADNIYPSNSNRRYCTTRKIFTNFPRKGRASSKEAEKRSVRALISKARSSQMEGCIGGIKQYYTKVREKSQASEIMMIFFSILVYNSLRMASKTAENKEFKEDTG